MSNTFTKFYSFTEAWAEKKHDLGSDTLKIMLSNSAPSVSNTQKTDITEISAGNGYSAGGTQATISSSAQSSGLYTLILNDVTFTASGGSIADFRYIILYNDTSTNDLLIAYSDYGSTVTTTSGNVFKVLFDPAGALTLT